jgi:hypothetical protein
VVTDLPALGRSVSADRDPSDGGDEEAEKRGLVHGGSIVSTVILLSNGMPNRPVQLKLPGGQIERKAAMVRDERLRADLTPTSMLAGREQPRRLQDLAKARPWVTD